MTPIVAVVGMKRSGTSLICQALERLGISFGSSLVDGDEANERGYYEHEYIVHNQSLLMHTCYDRIGWSDIGELVELDNKVEYANAYADAIEEILASEIEECELFGLKLPYLSRIPAVWGAIFTELELTPIYIHAMRDPMEVYASTLRANKTECKDTPAAYRHFLREWAWMNGDLMSYEPACTVWYEQWKEDVAGTMLKLAQAIGNETASTEGLLI